MRDSPKPLVFVTQRCKTLAIMIEGHDNFASLRFSTSVTGPKTKKKTCVTRKLRVMIRASCIHGF